MATVGSINIGMFVSTARLVKEVQSAGKHLGAFADSAKVKLDGLAKTIGIQIPTSFQGMATAIKSAMLGGVDRIDELGDAAQRIGVTAEALSKLRYAAELSGSHAEDLDMMLGKMDIALGEAAVKATPAGEALKRMGLEARHLAEVSPDKAFRAIATELSKIPNVAERNSAAFEIFGKSALRMVNTLASGPGEMDRLFARAEKLGVAVDQIDQAKIGLTKDALDDMGFAIEGLSNKLAVALSPAIKVVAEMFADWVASWGGAGKAMEHFVEGSVRGIAWIADGVFAMRQVWGDALAFVKDAWGRFLQFFGQGGDELIAEAARIRRDLDAEWAKGTYGQRLIAGFEKYKKKLDGEASDSAERTKKAIEGTHALGRAREPEKKSGHHDELPNLQRGSREALASVVHAARAFRRPSAPLDRDKVQEDMLATERKQLDALTGVQRALGRAAAAPVEMAL
jgi:hypothetical protein